MKKLLLYFLTLQILLFGCRHGEKTVESGYDDGYAEGYSSECRVKVTIVSENYWKSAEYSKGYNLGRNDGIQACANDKKNKNIN
jgi:hypothetical protein|tara:strand:+ start:74 stop:325 length:252 start_codon:yes stop_codon:yes gene_type:complete